MLLMEHVDIKEPKTKRETVLNHLRLKNLITYGSLITTAEIENIYQCRRAVMTEREWSFILLHAMSAIESLGYFATTRGKSGDVYIMQPHEMIRENEKSNLRMLQHLKGRQKGLYMIDTETLDAKNRKKLEFEILQNGSIEIKIHNELRKRCWFNDRRQDRYEDD